MKNKWFIIILTGLITFFCVYFLSFTYKAQELKDAATVYATNADGEINDSIKENYLDSLRNVTVYSFFGITDNNYNEVERYAIGLGLDLQGGMHIVLEVTPEGIIEALAGKQTSKKDKEDLAKMLDKAREASKDSQDKFTTLFYNAFQEVTPGRQLNYIFANSKNADRIGTNTTDDEILKILDLEIDRAVDRSHTILRSRIDKFGVTQPNLQKLQGTNRIQVELPGADNPRRVKKLIVKQAKLEFLETYSPGETYVGLMAYNDYLFKIEQAQKKLNPDLGEEEGEASADEPVEDLSALLGGADDDAQMGAADDDSTANADEFNEDADMEAGEDDQDLAIDGDSTVQDSGSGSLESQLNGTATADTTGAGAGDSSSFNRSSLFDMLSMRPNQNTGRLELTVLEKDKRSLLALLNNKDIYKFIPKNIRFLPDYKAISDASGKFVIVDGNKVYSIYAVKKGLNGKPPVSGDAVTEANYQLDPMDGGFKIILAMNPSGSRDWARLTKKLASSAKDDPRFVAIVLDDEVYSAPWVRVEIPNGRTEITGAFSKQEAEDLSNILKAGSMPAKLRIVESEIVGPSIGAEAVSSGLRSMIAGLCLVLIFMMLYYHKGGAVANIALLVNIFFIIGLLAQFGAALTLPGIAGIVLTIGMSIDANVLIFERIKEELALGRLPLQAIDNGFKKALVTILDSNITTFVTGAILAYFGSGPVKGFAITLMIGIGCSFFTAVFVSRLIIYWMGRKNEGNSLKFDTFISKGLFTNVNFNFIGRRKLAYLFSLSIITLGIVAIVIKGGLNLGVDFKGGRSYVVNFTEEVQAATVKTDITPAFGDASIEVKQYGQSNRLKVTTSYLVDEEGEEADDKVEETLMAGLAKYKELKPEIVSSSKVGATIADDIKETSIQAMLIAIVLIFLYIVVRFRKWQFGLGAIIALVHDVLIVISLFAITRLMGISYEIDQIFVAAILTIIGYSINDTVVVFDRVREFLTEKPSADTADTFNKSINSTLSRTLMTSLTTLLVVAVLLIFGGEALKGFSFALLIGVLFGTYSSIFIATPVVLDTAMRGGKKKSKPATPEAPKKDTKKAAIA